MLVFKRYVTPPANPSPGIEAEVAPRGNPEVNKMRRCALCKKPKFESELIGRLCSRCDHIQGDVMADLRAEFNAV